MPAGQPWMRGERPVASPEERLTMVRLAVGLNCRFSVLSLEVERKAPSYTVDTLEALSHLRLGTDLYLILGMDALLEFSRWREPARILELARVAVLPRFDYEAVDPGEKHPLFVKLPQLADRLVMLKGPRVEISATDIRRRRREGRSIRYLVPEAVEAYINTRSLYAPGVRQPGLP